MKALVGGLAAAAVLAAGAPMAEAGVVFDNGPAIGGSGGSDLTQWRAADDFLIAARTRVTGGTFTYGTSGAFVQPTNVRYYIFDTSGDGSANSPPGAVLASGLLTITDAYFIDDRGGQNLAPHYLAEFELETAFVTEAGKRYWFGLNAQAQGAEVQGPSFGWVASDFTSPQRTWEQTRFEAPPYTNWRSVDYERAFTLTGAAVAPEPAAWALMIGGFAAVGGLARRRRVGAPVRA